jgi:zinc protease
MVAEHRCANGLRALLLESHTAPVVCVSVWYRAGSRHDPPGRSGSAHLLEHMMFKGTRQHPKGEYDRQLHTLGAINNASTWLDRTNYYILIGSDRYAKALDLEADRMRGALLGAEDVEDERTVVLNELDRNEDDPGVALFDRIQARSFRQHPYRRPVIGLREDVAAISRADLRAFYDAHYQPGNAFLVAVGRFETSAMARAIDRRFGMIPAAEPARSQPADEPPQRTQRRFEFSKAGRQKLLGMAYHAPQRGHPDAVALDVLAMVLGHGRTSRLYRALVQTGLAVHASAEYASMPADPFLFMLDVELAQRADFAPVEATIDREIERLMREPVAGGELQRARKRARVGFISRRDSVSALAFLIGEFEIATGWEYLQTYLERLDAVTPADVMRVAERYLGARARTVGCFRPSDERATGAAGPADRAAGGHA